MKRFLKQNSRFLSWRWLPLALAMIVPGGARATDALFQNFSSLYYTLPGNPPTAYDVTAFDNENVFSVTYNIYSPYPLFYETWNTLFYTNNGTMVINTPLTTNILNTASFGCGYQFDLQTTNSANPHAFAGTFYNPGTIRCSSTNDGNNLFNFGGFTYFFINSFGECLVYATNIINPGTILVGSDGLIKLSSQNADFTFGSLVIEQPLTAGILSGGLGFINLSQNLPNVSATGSVGTNFVWSPSASLTATAASSPLPYYLNLTNSTPYIKVSQTGPSNYIVRAIFIQNNLTNVPYKAYFGSSPYDPLGNGAATIEWDGIYQDPASGNLATNFLYLNNDYVWGSSTNVQIFSGIPDNFTFTEAAAPFYLGAQATAGFQPIFFTAVVTNIYSGVNAQFLSSTVSTNSSASNPSGALTNILGKIFISASNDLNLANAQIYGENYLNLYAPHQFDGSQNAQIIAPYADINLGVTNGSLTLANLISAGVATLGGSIQAWSTEWPDVDGAGDNIDYRVLLVSSQLTAQSPSWIQNLRLHATNNLVISDVLNVYSSLYIDAQNLTITTNGYGNGFTSAAGQLNWVNTATFGPTQIPNVLWLTNNATISALNNSILGTSALRYGAFINNGLFADVGTTIWTTNFVNGGVITNGSGAFTLQSPQALMTNGALYAGGNISLTTSNLIITNELIIAGRSLTILATNLFTDILTNGLISSNYWSVGGLANTGDGLVMPIKPAMGDLLGTTITNIAPSNKSLINVWAGQDRGYSLSGYVNNEAVGHLVLDAQGVPNGRFTFNGASVSNAMYVDEIEFLDYSTNRDASGNMQGITFGTNMVIYFAQAIRNGVSFADKLNKQNTNNLYSHFRWMPTYAGYFSSTNIVYPDGTTNTFNAALKQSTTIDSDGDGIVNADDSTPFFIASQINFNLKITNAPPRYARLTWTTIPNATNTVMFKTNLLSPTWSVLTNFVSPQPYPSPASSVTILDPVGTNSTRFYRISVQPWLTYPN